MARHTLTHADQLYVGNGQAPSGGPRGVLLTPIYQHVFGAVAAASANAICASQSLNLGALGVINGALASGSVAIIPTPRNVVAAWTNTAVLTVKGTDMYGQPMTESSASGTSFTGKKAFKTVTQVTVSANVTALTVGTGVVLGLPYRLNAKRDILAGYADATLENATSTVAGADATTPTATTGDVRGTYSPATAPNGSVVFAVWAKVHDLSSTAGSYGLTNYNA